MIYGDGLVIARMLFGEKLPLYHQNYTQFGVDERITIIDEKCK